MRRNKLSISEARRIALAAQGFDRERPAAPTDVRHFRRVLDTLALLQLDYVNVLLPAHFLVPWSRLGAYERSRFADYLYASGECTEQWAHEASTVTIGAWPLLEHRRAAHRLHPHSPLRQLRGRNAYLDTVLREVEVRGACTANDLPPVPGPQRKPGDWHRSIPRRALDYHFARGALAVADRLANFQRVYDLPSRVIPQHVLTQRVDKQDAQRDLLRRSARALGVATLQDMADYFRMTARELAPALAELVTAGELSTVDVEGWEQPAYLHRDARLPRQIPGESLLSPFDPLVWFRPRALRLFDFHYRIEIYVPAAQRRWGYYVLPFRVGERLVARVDLKADRKDGTLLVRSLHAESHAQPGSCVAALARELASLCAWLGLEKVHVERHNGLARRLARALRA